MRSMAEARTLNLPHGRLREPDASLYKYASRASLSLHFVGTAPGLAVGNLAIIVPYHQSPPAGS